MTWKKAYDSRRVDRIQGEFFTRSALVSFLGCFDNVLALVLAGCARVSGVLLFSYR